MRDEPQAVLRRQFRATIGPDASQLLPARKSRVGLIISPPAAGTLYVDFDGPAHIGQGVRLAAGIQPLVLHGWHLLGALAEEISAASDAAPQTVDVVEFFF